jgi:NADPH-dependent 2,4-dienoyl-CoA reductase/sulfur reductase-like enzyme
VKLHTRVAAIRPEQKTLELSGGEAVPFDYLVVATGASCRRPDVPGERLEGVFCLRNVADAMRIKRFIGERRVRRAMVVGAGLVSLEMCEAFRCLDLETTLVYRGELPMHRLGEEFAQQILQELEGNGVTFMGGTKLEGFERASKGGLVVHTSNGSLETDLVLLGIGVVPEVAVASEAGLALGSTGAIAVDDRMQTSVPFIYAAGDCCESHHRVSRRPVYAPLGDIANKQGRIAGANIGGQSLSFPGIVGSICFRVFGLEVASTGLTENEAREAGLKPVSATIKGVSKAHIYPGAAELRLRVVAEAEGGRLLGAQGVGGDGVVSRINALATALTGGLSLEDLAYLDLAYAPPFSGAWDPVHIAAQQLLK